MQYWYKDNQYIFMVRVLVVAACCLCVGWCGPVCMGCFIVQRGIIWQPLELHQPSGAQWVIWVTFCHNICKNTARNMVNIYLTLLLKCAIKFFLNNLYTSISYWFKINMNLRLWILCVPFAHCVMLVKTSLSDIVTLTTVYLGERALLKLLKKLHPTPK